MTELKPIRFIQTSAARSGSTVLSNILMAFFQPYESVCFMGKHTYNKDLIKDNIVIKTHDKNIDDWISRFGSEYDLYFIISDRGDYDWDKYYQYDKTLFIPYEDLLENEENLLSCIVENLYTKLKEIIPKEYMIHNREQISIQNGINRINNMNDRYEKIKSKPFEFVDKYYQIHGHHRNNRKG